MSYRQFHFTWTLCIGHPGPGAGDFDQVETGLIFVQEVSAV